MMIKFIAFTFFTIAFSVSAQSKVVVVPLLEDVSKVESVQLKNIITVSPENGDFSNISSAMNSITSNSVSNRFLIFVGPGSYFVDSQIVMKPYVDIAGSGRNVTVLKSKIQVFTSEMISGIGNSTIVDLSIEIDSTAKYPTRTAMRCDGACTDLERINIVVSSDSNNRPPSALIYDGADAKITNSQIRTIGFNGGYSSAVTASLGTVKIYQSELISLSSNSKTVTCFHCSLHISNTEILSGGGEGIWVDENSGADEIHIKKSSIQVYGGTAVFNPINNPIPVYISQSSLLSNSGSPTTTGDNIYCVNSDNGKGKELNPDCSYTPPS